MVFNDPAPLSITAMILNLVFGLGLSVLLAIYYAKFGDSYLLKNLGQPASVLHPIGYRRTSIYETAEVAKASLEFWKRQSFTNNWATPEESRFAPSNPNDFYVLKCLPSQINRRESEGCTAI